MKEDTDTRMQATGREKNESKWKDMRPAVGDKRKKGRQGRRRRTHHPRLRPRLNSSWTPTVKLFGPTNAKKWERRDSEEDGHHYPSWETNVNNRKHRDRKRPDIATEKWRTYLKKESRGPQQRIVWGIRLLLWVLRALNDWFWTKFVL